jgi:hypothetical protein
MKKIKNSFLLAIFTVIFVSGVFSSCNDELQLKSLPYLFRPVGFNASINKTIVTISWAEVDSAKSYTLQVSTDSLFRTRLVDTTTTKLSFTKEYAGETKFFARIRSNDRDSTKDSKFNNKFSDGTYSFTTPKENIFLGYGTSNNTGTLYSAYMTDVNTLDIKWAPGSNATHLILQSADGNTKDSVHISGSEALAGEKIVSSLSNSIWSIKIFNNTILRGTTSGLIEGDIVLSSGGDLVGALNGASAGQVIVLAPGAVFSMGIGTYRFSKDIKIRGLSVKNRPVLCMTSGATTTSSAFGFVDGSSMNYVKFENIDFTGFCDNSSTNTKIGYLINNNVATHVKSLSFKNCNLHNYGNTPMRLQGSKAQAIDTLAFNGCIINEVGFASTYAVVNTNTNDNFGNIYFSNCTVYNFKNGFIVRQTTAAVPVVMGNVNITNCTINQGIQDPAAIRYLMDLNFVTFVPGGGITIKNCILGQTGSLVGAAGVRSTIASTAITNTGSYYTSDYVDETIVGTAPNTFSYTIKAAMTAYSGLSTSLWNSPSTGDFSLKDSAFKGKGVAGDLRY